MPVHTIETLNKLRRISNGILQEKGRNAKMEELAKRSGIAEKKVRGLLEISRNTISLETPVGSDEDATLGELLEDDKLQGPIEEAVGSALQIDIEELLKGLTTQETKVLSMRFGLGFDKNYTFDEIGNEENLSRERIRQIEARALRKLRNPSRSEHLRSFLE